MSERENTLQAHRTVTFYPQAPTVEVAQALTQRGISIAVGDGPEWIFEGAVDHRIELVVLFADREEARALCRDLRGTPRGAVLPVIIVGREGGDILSAADAIDVGGDAFVEASASPQELAERIEIILGMEPPVEAFEEDPEGEVVQECLVNDAIVAEADPLGEPVASTTPRDAEDPVERALMAAGITTEDLEREDHVGEERFPWGRCP